jgi:hypothetical protein
MKPLHLLVALAILAMLYNGERAAKAQVVFFDGTFNDTNWTVAQSQGDLISAGQVASGGNPGSYRKTQLFVGEVVTNAASVNSTFLYNPATQGAITGLAFSADLITTNAEGGLYDPFIQQAGVSYFDPHFPGIATSNVWLNRAQILNLGDFIRFDGAPGSPNFTSTGSAIEFGYVDFVGGAGFFESDTGIDNYAFTLATTPVPGSVPEPGAVALFVGMGVFGSVLLLRRRKRCGLRRELDI